MSFRDNREEECMGEDGGTREGDSITALRRGLRRQDAQSAAAAQTGSYGTEWPASADLSPPRGCYSVCGSLLQTLAHACRTGGAGERRAKTSGRGMNGQGAYFPRLGWRQAQMQQPRTHSAYSLAGISRRVTANCLKNSSMAPSTCSGLNLVAYTRHRRG